ncbi:hypothetical protein [Candidatus Cryosericum terrychapinii]|uniref:Uncharacterized protein n=1 Tax=Candidatus Cryosericum terrychapinii TaxID=2290919 RepID=A0A398D3F7_9BACT|nr:hypothetical protein [Candidatus Cryosericum terrychapinii]RIE06797.1 hypothetical protein SMC7_00685 [Candidatus Cryosericum terrychapinii]
MNDGVNIVNIVSSLKSLRDAVIELSTFSSTRVWAEVWPALIAALSGAFIGAFLAFLLESKLQRTTIRLQTEARALSETTAAADLYVDWLDWVADPAVLARNLFGVGSQVDEISIRLTMEQWMITNRSFDSLHRKLEQYLVLFGPRGTVTAKELRDFHNAILADVTAFLDDKHNQLKLMNVVALIRHDGNDPHPALDTDVRDSVLAQRARVLDILKQWQQKLVRELT